MAWNSAFREAFHAVARGVGYGSSVVSLFGLRCRRERTGASCAGGSGFSPDAGYKWLGRWADRWGTCGSLAAAAFEPVADRTAIEASILAVRDAHPAWGARKIARCLEREGSAGAGGSTVHEILRRHGRIVAAAGRSCRR